MDNFHSLREYQEYLRDRMKAARLAENSDKLIYLGFVSGGRHFLINGKKVLNVHQISQLQPIPVAKPWAIGAANIKGSVFAVTDLSLLLGGEATKKGKFLVISPKIITGSAILIESISGLFESKSLGENQPHNDLNLPNWVDGCHQLDQKYHLINVDILAQDQRFSKLQNGGA